MQKFELQIRWKMRLLQNILEIKIIVILIFQKNYYYLFPSVNYNIIVKSILMNYNFF